MLLHPNMHFVKSLNKIHLLISKWFTSQEFFFFPYISAVSHSLLQRTEFCGHDTWPEKSFLRGKSFTTPGVINNEPRNWIITVEEYPFAVTIRCANLFADKVFYINQINDIWAAQTILFCYQVLYSSGYTKCSTVLVTPSALQFWLHQVLYSSGYWLHQVLYSSGYTKCSTVLVTPSALQFWLHQVLYSSGYTKCSTVLVTPSALQFWLHQVLYRELYKYNQ